MEAARGHAAVAPEAVGALEAVQGQGEFEILVGVGEVRPGPGQVLRQVAGPGQGPGGPLEVGRRVALTATDRAGEAQHRRLRRPALGQHPVQLRLRRAAGPQPLIAFEAVGGLEGADAPAQARVHGAVGAVAEWSAIMAEIAE